MSQNIHEAINAVMQEVGYVKKTKSGGLNYSFAGEAALIAALRPAMVEHGVYMAVSKINGITRENYTTAKGTAMVNTVISADVVFTHAPSGTFVTIASVGEGSDAGDKSANKAMTGLYKYALRQTFCIETGDDPDKYASEERAASELTMHERYQRLYGRAVKAGVPDIKNYDVDLKKATDAEITTLGLELLAKVEAAEKGAK